MLDPRGASDLAEVFLRQHAEREQRRRQLRGRLRAVNRAIAAADEYEANQAMPDDLRRELPAPLLSYEDLVMLHETILEKLGELEAR